MILGIYLGSTVLSWYYILNHFRKMDKRLKKEGYEFVKGHRSLGDILVCFVIIIVLAVPFFNIMIPFMLKDINGTYDEYKNHLLEAGSIYKNVDDDVIKVSSSKLTQRFNRDNHPYYSSSNKEIESESKEQTNNKTSIGYITGIENTIKLIDEVSKIDQKKQKQSIGYITGIENTIKLIEEVKEIDQKKMTNEPKIDNVVELEKKSEENEDTIIINRAKLVPRTSRYGHIYYSSSMDIEDDTIDSGYTYKKIRK